MYRVRCSSLNTLLAGCGKVNNKFEWTKLDTMNDSHIKLAISIYNKENGFTPAEIKTLDMSAGTELEPEGVLLYDEFHKTNFYPDYIKSRENLGSFEKSNDFITGTRDFGNDIKTIDCKTSTDKNVFDCKKFEPIEPNYVVAMNGYSWLYGTPELELYNVLMSATFGQIKKFVGNKAYIDEYSEEQTDIYQQMMELNYDYRFLDLSKRIDTKPVPIIENFEEIITKRVQEMNKWIEKNKHRF
jgi:hypothetical protein